MNVFSFSPYTKSTKKIITPTEIFAKSILELRQVRSWVNGLARNTVLVLIVVGDRLCRWLLLLNHLLVIAVTALLKVRDASSSTRIQHLLARLRIQWHHLVMDLLFLLQLVVQCLELIFLRYDAAAVACIIVLSELHLRAKAIYLIVVGATLHANCV